MPPAGRETVHRLLQREHMIAIFKKKSSEFDRLRLVVLDHRRPTVHPRPGGMGVGVYVQSFGCLVWKSVADWYARASARIAASPNGFPTNEMLTGEFSLTNPHGTIISG